MIKKTCIESSESVEVHQVNTNKVLDYDLDAPLSEYNQLEFKNLIAKREHI